MMQLLSFLFKCKLYFILFKYFQTDSWLAVSGHLFMSTYFFLILKIFQTESHINMGIFFFFFNSQDHSLSF